MRPHAVLAVSIFCAAVLALPGPAQAQSREQQFAQLLLSSAWCTLSYNKVSGTSRTARYQFFNNGTWAGGSQRETYSSGPNGTVSGQSNGRQGGRWAVQNGMFLMSEGGAQMGQVAVDVKQNSNGYPIIVADGVEYSQCR
jgi:hypothetical protein